MLRELPPHFCLPTEGQHVLILVLVLVVLVVVLGIITSFFDIETCWPFTSLTLGFLRLLETFLDFYN